jgi:CRISPR-associated endonuclease Cas2
MLLVAYDVRDDGRREKVALALTRLGRRVQLSVFLVDRHTPREVSVEIEPLIDLSEDDVRIHSICVSCEDNSVLLGLARPLDRAMFRVL